MGKNKAAVLEAADDDELELMDDADEPDEKPKAKSKSKGKAAAAPVKDANGYGVAWLTQHVNDELGTSYTDANIRVILRKMAKDGELEREVGEDRARYSFTGEGDRTVKAVLKRVKSGEADTAKADRLEVARSGKGSANVKRNSKAAAIEEEPKAKAKPTRKKGDEEPKVKPKATRRRRSDEDE